MPESVEHNFIQYPIQHMPSVQVIASVIILKHEYTDASTLIPCFSVYSGLPLFSAGLSVLLDRKNELIYLL